VVEALVDEVSLHRWVAWGVIAAALPTLAWLLFVTAPYGRHGRPGWGPTLPARAGWILMESPAVFVWLAVYFRGAQRFELVPLLLLAMWQVHYVHRTLIFPFRLRAERPVPLVIAALGFGFNSVNAWLNARHVSELGAYPPDWLWTPWFAAGAGLFVVGLVTNLYADTVFAEPARAG
jgi:hypothetical protein